jgi:hypothetical protein
MLQLCATLPREIVRGVDKNWFVRLQAEGGHQLEEEAAMR